MIVHEPVQAIIWHCLNHYAYADAIFLAERWHAEVTSEETTFLLGTCYYRAGRINEAYWLLRNAVPSSSHTRFLLAKCAIDLNYYSEAENALGNNVDAVSADFGEEAPFALQLLAKVYNATERRSTASEVHRKALHLNPFVWDSFAQLCNMGEKVDPQSIFQASNVENFSTCHGISQTVTLVNNTENVSLVNSVNVALTGNNAKMPVTNATPRFASHMSSAITPDSQVPARRLHSVFGGLPPQSPFSPSFGLLPIDDSPVVVYTPTLTDSNEQKAIPKIVNSLRAHVGQLKEAVFSPAPRCALGPAPRRSSRLFSNNSSYSVKENNKSPCRKFAPKSPSRKSKQRSAKNNVSKSSNAEPIDKVRGEAILANGSLARTTGAEGLLLLLRDLGSAYRALVALDCQKAIQLFEECPPRQFRSPWVQTMVAQAYYELADYEPATRIFADIRRHHPRRTEGMDIYGTCLWHLQREADLSALAQDLVSSDRGNPISWLVAGNCFSLHKERDAALKFFRRAVQLAPDTSYAHALLGHEYAAAEETEKALTSFRNAVRLNPRNYGAWFGIATVYAKQERWKSAETHFRRAIVVHPSSAVLRCHLGVAQAALGRADRALATLRLAVSRDPRNPLCRFQLASVLLSAGRPLDALTELNRLKDTAPRESLVYYLLGKVHNKLGDQHLALMHFSWATDLDPKGTSGHIKEGFDPSKPEEPPEQTT